MGSLSGRQPPELPNNRILEVKGRVDHTNPHFLQHSPTQSFCIQAANLLRGRASTVPPLPELMRRRDALHCSLGLSHLAMTAALGFSLVALPDASEGGSADVMRVH